MRSRGFGLIELMVALLIAAILLAAGVPALQSFAAEQQLAGAANAFFHGASLTRAEALRQGSVARMTPADGRDWASGWSIEAGGRPVMTQPPLPRGVAVSHGGGGDAIAYKPGGQPLARATWHFNGGGKARLVAINFLGRIRVCNPQADSRCGAEQEAD
jgi:type IV fimbrial biogenesis protein FimT